MTERELAQLLAALRRAGRQQSGLDPRLVPSDKEAAYRVARMVEEVAFPFGKPASAFPGNAVDA